MKKIVFIRRDMCAQALRPVAALPGNARRGLAQGCSVVISRISFDRYHPFSKTAITLCHRRWCDVVSVVVSWAGYPLNVNKPLYMAAVYIYIYIKSVMVVGIYKICDVADRISFECKHCTVSWSWRKNMSRRWPTYLSVYNFVFLTLKRCAA